MQPPFQEAAQALVAPNEFEMLFIRLPLAAVLGTALALRPRRRSQGARKVVVIQTQIMLAVVGAVIYAVLPTPAPGDIAGRVIMTAPRDIFLWFTYLNVMLAVFNMVPVPPLDGGNVLLGVLPPAGARIIELLRPYGFLILYALMLSGVLSYLLGPIAIGVVRFLLRIP